MKMGIALLCLLACIVLILNMTGILGGNPILSFIAAFGLIMIIGIISAVLFAAKRKNKH